MNKTKQQQSGKSFSYSSLGCGSFIQEKRFLISSLAREGLVLVKPAWAGEGLKKSSNRIYFWVIFFPQMAFNLAEQYTRFSFLM